MTDEAKEIELDPITELHKEVMQMKNEIESLKKSNADKDKLVAQTVTANKRLLTELNNKPVEQINVSKRSYMDIAEETMFKELKIKK